MSEYVTPFIYLNLGAEMVFVVAQRLQAQHIQAEKRKIVLDEIVAVLVSEQLIGVAMRPQPAYGHEAVRELIEEVTQSSMMRLDATSMGKLWDLITMIFKWQTTMGDDLIKLTQRHLYEIETYVAKEATQLRLHQVQALVDNFGRMLTFDEQEQLLEGVRDWLSGYSVRVSLLLRMGLQKLDGSFTRDRLEGVAEGMLRNLGENVYAVTQNGRILEANKKEEAPQQSNELQLFVEQILGSERRKSSETNVLRLIIDNNSDEVNANGSVEVAVVESGNGLAGDFNSFEMDLIDDGSLTDELLEMIKTEAES